MQAIFLYANLAHGQERIVLAPSVVTATRVEQPLEQIPASVSFVEREDIQRGRLTLGIDESLNRVAGVLAQNSGNYAQDIRLQVRGFGARAEFGIREVRVLLDGLPETLADGQTDLDHIDMGAIERIEVLRGPASSLYGNAAGGVLQLFTEKPPEQPMATSRVSGGSFGMQKYEVKGGGQIGNLGAFVHASYLSLDGYRDHAAAQSTIATARLRYQANDDTHIALLLNAVDAPRGDDAGGLRRAEADTDPTRANPRNVQFEAGEKVQQGRIGLTAARRFADGDLSAYAYALYRDFANRLPIGPPTPAERGGVVTFYRFSPGAGLRYAKELPLWGRRQRFSLGVDVQHQRDERRRFANLDGQQGELGLRQREEVTGIGPYLRYELALTPRLSATAGLRYDAVRFGVDVEYPDGSSSSRTLSAWSPSAGLSFQALPRTVLFWNLGHAFQTPTTTELANPAGAGFNPDVEPQRAWSTEIGSRSYGDGWSFSLAGFFIDVSDVLVRYETTEQPGRAFFRNAAQARRYGVETEWQVHPLPGLRWTSALTATATNFSEGPSEPGIPPWQVYEELRYDHSPGWFAVIEALAMDGYSVESQGRAKARPFELCNLRAGYVWHLGGLAFEPFVGLNNVTNVNYDARIRINDANQRYFEPGPRFQAYGGIRLQGGLQ